MKLKEVDFYTIIIGETTLIWRIIKILIRNVRYIILDNIENLNRLEKEFPSIIFKHIILGFDYY